MYKRQALPSIAQQFTVPLTDLVWIVDGYTLTFAALLLVAGALADRYGAKTIYLAGERHGELLRDAGQGDVDDGDVQHRHDETDGQGCLLYTSRCV